MHRPMIDFLAPEFIEVLTRVHERTKRVLKTEQHLLYYGTNGHGAWEGALANVFSPGDKMLMVEFGSFLDQLGEDGRELGLEVEMLPADWRLGVPAGALEDRLRQTPATRSKASWSSTTKPRRVWPTRLADIRAEMNAAGHPAMLLVDTISSLASFDFRFDEWGVDLAVGGSQKGLMMIAGLSFIGISDRAMAASANAGITRSFVDWKQMMTVKPQRFPGTTAVHLFYGLDEALRILEQEGLEAVFDRHARLAGAIRAAIAHWGEGAASGIRVDANGPSGPVEQARTSVRRPKPDFQFRDCGAHPNGVDANHFRRIALQRYNLSLGQGLGPLAGKVFRIGHLGDLNEPMVLGALATMELAMRDAGLAHQSGGIDAALTALGSIIARTLRNMSKSLVQEQFGPNAANYVMSDVHAKGKSLQRLVDLVKPEADWQALDIATGGGHTAFAFAPHVKHVVASDLTPEMLMQVQGQVTERAIGNVSHQDRGRGSSALR